MTRARTPLPGPLVRIARNRLAVLGLVLNAAVALTAANVGEAAQVRIVDDVDSHWRGAYDILVRPAGARLNLDSTNQLVEPNFLDFGSAGGITLEQLAQVRMITDVAVAAPISTVGYLQYVASSPTLRVGAFPTEPRLYSVHLVAVTSDGLGEIPVAEQDGRLLLAPGGAASSKSFARFATDLGSMSGGEDGLTVGFAGVDVAVTAPLMAVDPVAEAALLGDRGSFLGPLAAIEADRVNMATQIPRVFRFAKFDLTGATPIPLLLSSRVYAPLTLRLDIAQIGGPVRVPPVDEPVLKRLAEAEAEAGSGSQAIASLELDATDRLVPFLPLQLQLTWPGSPPAEGESFETKELGDFDARLPLRPTYGTVAARPGSTATSFKIETVASSGSATTSYRLSRSYSLALKDQAVEDGLARPFDVVPLGTFDLSSFADPGDPIAYVPFGAYDPPDTALVAGPDGTPMAPRPMSPTLDPSGLISMPPLAITDMAAAGDLRGAAPIDAIRVRVAGLTGFDADARTRVERVASGIADLGLDVDIVAGSSPAPVELYVPGYRSGAGIMADLGWVSQRWTSLGAAERVERGLGQLNVVLLLLALGVALVVAAGVQNLALAARVREIAVLRAIGWSPWEVARWFGAEALVAALVIGFAALLGFAVAGGRVTAALAGLGLAAVSLLSPILGTILAWRRAGPSATLAGDTWAIPRVAARLPVRGALSYALRGVMVRPVRTVTLAVALGLSAAAVGLAVDAVASVAARAGPTLLADAVTSTLRPYQLGLLGLSAAGGIVLVAVGLRIDIRSRAEELLVLTATGWSGRRVRFVGLAERAFIATLATAVATAFAVVAAVNIGDLSPQLAAGIAALAAVSVVAWGGLVADPARIVRLA
jgi:hypothetical protein